MLYQPGCFTGAEKGNEFFLVNNKLSLFLNSVRTAWVIISDIAVIRYHRFRILLLTVADRMIWRWRQWDWDIWSVIHIDYTAMVSWRRHAGLRWQLCIPMVMMNIQWNNNIICINCCIDKVSHWRHDHWLCLSLTLQVKGFAMWHPYCPEGQCHLVHRIIWKVCLVFVNPSSERMIHM